MKYRVTLTHKNIWIADREVKLVAVSAEHAKSIATIRYKDCTPTKAVRLGSGESTVKTLNTLRDDFIKAKDTGDKEMASRCQKTFYSTMASLQSEMDCVAFSMAKKHLPDLPPIGK